MNDYGDNYPYGDSPFYKDDSGAAVRYWVSPSFSNWNNTANWSATSGGPSGASVPDYHTIVYFDCSGLGDCLIDIPVLLSDIVLSKGYDATVFQNGYGVTLTSLAFFDGGVYKGNNYAVTQTKNVYLGGGYVQNAIFYVSRDMTCASSHNQWTSLNDSNLIMNGTISQNVYVQAGGIIPSLSVDKTDFNHVLCQGDSPIIIKDNLLIQDGTFNTNGIDIQVGS